MNFIYKMTELTIGLAVVAIALIYYYFTSNFNHWRDKGVAFVKPYPLLGSMAKVLTLQEHLSECYQKFYNDHSEERFIGFYNVRKPTLMIKDLEIIKNILIKDFSHFTDHGFDFSEENDPLQARNLFNMSGQKWRNMRAKLTPTFTSGRMKAMCPLVIECAEVFEKHLESLADTNVDLDIKDLLARYTTDVIGNCAFGIKVDTINDPQDIFRVQGRKLFESDFSRGLRFGLLTAAPQIAHMLKVSLLSKNLDKFFRNLVRNVIELREKDSSYKRNDFMQLLMELKEKGRLLDEHEDGDVTNDLINGQIQQNTLHSETKFTDDDITAQALVFFLAGFETSSSAMSFAMVELARRPELQRTARLHIEEVLQRHGGKITYQALQEMTYLDWILQESMRKYPPLPFLNRKCNKNYLIPGTNITIEKGQPIVIPIRSLQNDAKYFPEPERFDPERFNPGNSNQVAFSYMPFGEGPRQCIGLRFARMQSKLGLIAVLRKYEVRPSTATKYPLSWDPKFFLLISKHDIFIKLIRLVVVAIALIYYYLTSTFNHWRDKGVEFVKPYPIVGSMTKARTPSLLIMDPELIKSILIKDFSHFTDHGLELSEKYDPLLARNLFNMNGQKWKNMRAKLTPTFTSGRMKAMCPLVIECAEVFEKHLESLADTNVDLDIKIAKILKTSIFSKELDLFFRNLVREVLESRKKNSSKQKDFMQLLMEIKEKGRLLDEHEDEELKNDLLKGSLNYESSTHSEIKFTDDDITAQALVFFNAGFETSSSAMTFALFEMARSPELQRTARLHIEEVLQRHGGNVTYQALQEMTYLDWILQESLRKYPTLPFLNRKCNKNYVCPGTNLTIESGQLIAIPLRSMQNDAKYFPDPERFDPERFNPENGNQFDFCYMPFGEGPRQCIDHGLELSEKYDPLQARNLFNMSGQKWKNMRAKLTPTFTSGRMKAMCPLVIECAEVFEKHLESLADTNVDLDIKVRLFVYNIDRDVKHNCNDTINELRKKNSSKQKDFMQLLMEIKEKGRLLDEHEDEELKNDLLNGSLNDESSTHTEIKFTDDDITAQALVFFIAGFETSSSAMTFALFEMARRPELQRTARLHIEEVLQRHGGKVTYQALQEMTYLDWIVQESLRKYPPLPFLNRKCNKNYLLPGTNLIIENGQLIAIPLRSMQNDAKYFPDPERFDPERFNPENGNQFDFCYMPFGEGPRQCIGLRFGKMQSKLGLMTVLRKYEVRPSSTTKYPLSWNPRQVVLVSKYDIAVKLIRAKNYASVVIFPSSEMLLEMVLGSVTALLVVYYYFICKLNYWRSRGIKSMPSHVIVGSMGRVIRMREHLSDFYQRAYDEATGQPYIGYYLGGRPGLVVRDPDLIKKIMVKDFSNFMDHGIQDLLARYTTDVIGTCAFGIKSDSIHDPHCHFRMMGRKILETNIWQAAKQIFFRYAPKLSRSLRLKLMSEELVDFFRNMVRDVTRQRLSTGEIRKDFIQLLLELKEKGHLYDERDDNNKTQTKRLTDDDITAQALVFFFAGFETSSSTMTFALFELARRPELQRTARQHIEEVLQRHNGELTYNFLESLRMYPPLAFLLRICTTDYVLPGTEVNIESGLRVVIPIRALQNDPKFFPEPNTFNPERFISEHQRMRFAYVQSKLGLLAVLRNYEVQSDEKIQYPLSWNTRQFLLVSKDDIRLKFKSIT
ncbi:hypothetical protein B566_EDAN007686 [Ephemera danica]|nr:hypothetical protein B566_EDAN007686 [Ephemera danica]